MIGVTLKQLRYFDALAHEMHFGRAAEICAVTQPALSMQIRELETILGTTLIERARGGIRLTPTGVKIAARAARIINDTHDLIDIAQHSERVLTGTLRLGVIPSVAPYLLPPLLPILRANYPLLELNIRETQTVPLTEELVGGKLDVLFLALPVDHPDIVTLPLFDDRFLLAVPKNSKLSTCKRVTPNLLKKERLLLLEEGHCLRDQALNFCNLQDVDALKAFGASSLTTIVEMVAAGLGITLLPEICQRAGERSNDIALMRFDAPEPSRALGLAWRKTSPRRNEYVELGRMLLQAKQDLTETFQKNSGRPKGTKQKMSKRSPKKKRSKLV